MSSMNFDRIRFVAGHVRLYYGDAYVEFAGEHVILHGGPQDWIDGIGSTENQVIEDFLEGYPWITNPAVSEEVNSAFVIETLQSLQRGYKLTQTKKYVILLNLYVASIPQKYQLSIESHLRGSQSIKDKLAMLAKTPITHYVLEKIRENSPKEAKELALMFAELT